jgi:thioredoxin
MRSRPSVVYVVDFYADWCGPCKALAPFFERLAATHGVPGVLEFLKVNVDDVPEAAVQANISAMPTFQIWRGGELQAEIVGGSQDKLVAIVGKAAALAGV